MRRFDIVKTTQLVIFGVLALAAFVVIVRDDALYQAIATNPHVRALCAILWLTLSLSFVFMLYDFGSYATLKRENSELDYAVYADQLTGIANRYSCDAHIARYAEGALPPAMACVTMDLTSLRAINKARGHTGGDEAIRAFSRILSGAAEDRCFVGRNGGNKFLSIFEDTTAATVDAYVGEVAARVAEYNQTAGDAAIAYVVGVALEADEGQVRTLPELVALSDRRAMAQEGA